MLIVYALGAQRSYSGREAVKSHLTGRDGDQEQAREQLRVDVRPPGEGLHERIDEVSGKGRDAVVGVAWTRQLRQQYPPYEPEAVEAEHELGDGDHGL